MFGNQKIPKDIDDKMVDVVKLKVFTTLQDDGYRQCPACENTIEIVRSLANATSKLEFEEISILKDKAAANKFKVTRAPTIIIQGHGIRYTGAPIGQETAPFIYTIIMASQGTSIFGDTLIGKLGNLKRARLTLLVTPTCPYCAQAVLIENSLVMDSEKNLSIDIVETYENPDIARQYNVTGVPVTVFNGNPLDTIVGVPTLGALLQKLRS